MSTQMIIRIDPKVKNQFSKLAKMEGKSTSQMARDLIDHYIRERDIGSYIDDLWERTGKKIKRNKITAQDIDRIIKEVRANKS